MLPSLNNLNRDFWTGGAQGELLIQRCTECRRWTHPPAIGCTFCGGELTPEPVSGIGTIFTFTVNHQPFHPDVSPPYVIALVELSEQADLRIPTNIVHCDASTLECGTPVRLLFERCGEIFYPIFEPLP